MAHVYNKRHVQISVSAATVLGLLFGFWLGKRMEVAGLFEALAVWITFLISSVVVFSRIDEKYLPESGNDKAGE
ncbi:MAG: hypothetical protein U1D29_14225 [Burkholderiales bacterium]|nr:hypothetical protein [Burkholderiales bacterium]